MKKLKIGTRVTTRFEGGGEQRVFAKIVSDLGKAEHVGGRFYAVAGDSFGRCTAHSSQIREVSISR